MAETLVAVSTVASIVSLADVTIRACEGIYGLVASWRNAPRAVQNVRQTVNGVESILRNLKTFVEEYKVSVAFQQHHQSLPDSINADITSIRENLGLLVEFLRSAGQVNKSRQRAKWTIQEKNIAEIIQRLEKQQVGLILSLQTVAQRSSTAHHHDMFKIETNLKQSHADSTEQVLNALKPISWRLDEVVRNETSASMGQSSRTTSIEALRETNLELQNSLGSKIDGLVSSVSGAAFVGDSLRSETLLRSATNDALARIFRAELKQVVIPIVEEGLNSYKSASEAQITAVRESIDSMANELHQSLQGISKQDGNTTFQDPGPKKAGSQTNNQEHPRDSATASFSIHQHPETRRATANDFDVGSDMRLWIRTWNFRWRVGTLQVTVSAFKKSRYYQTVSNAYQISHTNEPRMAYKVLITFIPTQTFWTFRGTSISCRNQRDHRGYLELCPMLSFFAVVPNNSDVLQFAGRGDLAGLRQLFRNRAGSPTDRDEDGGTSLHVAALFGQYEICKFLLTEGADLLATCTVAGISANCLEFLIMAYTTGPWIQGWPSRKNDYCGIARLLKNAGSYMNDGFCGPSNLAKLSMGLYPLGLKHCGDLLTFYRYQILETDAVAADELAQELMNCLSTMREINRLSFYGYDALPAVYFLCGLGANVRATGAHGQQPLHLVFSHPWPDEQSSKISDQVYLLMKHGADVWACDDNGNTPSSLALKHNRRHDWCKILERCGLDPEFVFKEESDRQWNRQHLNNAERSGVDTEELEYPGHEVSFRRRGRYTLEDNE